MVYVSFKPNAYTVVYNLKSKNHIRPNNIHCRSGPHK